MPAGRDQKNAGIAFCLPPVTGEEPAVLILGSFPSRRSLETGQYYANPNNQFWQVIENLLQVPRTLPY